ncbi:hypothetical protein [Umboniibacter marinipuniceus]|uniref:Uncharacterized protein n=1 Tax=Umboniibacter marinipuniceus TaxID=569599 RepID=A0A3M0AIY3_9GAMM|nr:hypothetical protein [Umboniibacter marinipuniceus]RMA82678.1 hypothetical protein DFR27_0631 [Umboniibacter marinipuniceus]
MELKTYMATSLDGQTVIVTAYTETEAREKAEEQLGWGNVYQFSEM